MNKNEPLFSEEQREETLSKIYKILHVLKHGDHLPCDRELTLASEILLYFEYRKSDLEELNNVLEIVKTVIPITESLKAILRIQR